MNAYRGPKYLFVKEIEGSLEHISEPPEQCYRNPRRNDSLDSYNKNNTTNPFRLKTLLLPCKRKAGHNLSITLPLLESDRALTNQWIALEPSLKTYRRIWKIQTGHNVLFSIAPDAIAGMKRIGAIGIQPFP